MDSSFFIDESQDFPTLDFDKSPAILAVHAATKFTRKLSRHLQLKYGIGAMDWRMLVILTREEDIPGARATSLLDIDKAAVSRALTRLKDQGLVDFKILGKDTRRKLWRLTPKGRDLHAEMLETALEMQDQLIEGFTYLEVKTLNKLMHQMLENIEGFKEV
ncbi:MAG: MarR family transcriptional regulator [Alphaproteobacteria bacterium]|nr:MarR family transcriptional regulator [Alphaproteobacteria bacterium]